MSENKNIQVEAESPKEKKRLRWIDQARGFIMLYLVIILVFPKEWTNSSAILNFLFSHADKRALNMTLYDVGAASFIFLLGLMMSVSYRKRSEKYGNKNAILHIVKRYGILLILGILTANLDFEFVHWDDSNTFFIVNWDVIISIAVAGIVTFLFIAIKDPKIRIIAGFVLVLTYQILMVIPFNGWVFVDGNYFLKEYALQSVHGGIFGSMMGYASVSIVASGIGDYFFTESNIEESQKYKNLLIFGIITLFIGLAISYIPGWEANKRQVSFTHVLISIGVTVIGLWVFSFIDRKMDKELHFLRAYGMNPFFVYFLVEVPNALVKEIVGTDLGMEPAWLGNVILMIVYLVYTSIIMMKLYKKKKVYSTEKAALIFLGTTIVLAVLLIGLGLI